MTAATLKPPVATTAGSLVAITNVPVVGTGNATLNIHSAGHQSPIGTAHVIVTGTSGSLSHSITVLYTVSF